MIKLRVLQTIQQSLVQLWTALVTFRILLSANNSSKLATSVMFPIRLSMTLHGKTSPFGAMKK
jgi:hypothetical protein